MGLSRDWGEVSVMSVMVEGGVMGVMLLNVSHATSQRVDNIAKP